MEKNYYKDQNLPTPHWPKCPIDKCLQGQKAIVTGSSSGLGKAIAIALGQAGAEVIVNYSKDQAGAQEAQAKIEACGGHGHIYQANIAHEEEISGLFRFALEKMGRLDILVNNAGIQKDAPLTSMTTAQWDDVMNINLRAQFIASREAAKIFEKQGVSEEISCAAGKIICISSVHDIIPWAGHINYAASKGGVSMLMKSIAQELAPKRIRVNAISPGAIRTPINTEAWSTPEAYAELMKLIPYKRIGEAEEIGRVAVWLASDQSDYITGSTLYVDGGMTLYPGFESGG